MPCSSQFRTLWTAIALAAVAAISLFSTPLRFMTSAAAADWSQFRGPNGQGHCSQTDLPVHWSEREGIVWKKPIAGRGWSTPVALDHRLWLTTATEEGHSLRAICVNSDSGRIERDVEVFTPQNPVHRNAKNSHASPSPIVEPGRVYVHYGSMGTACLDSETGKILWRNQELVVDHGEGPGSSPILFRNLLIVNCDGQDLEYVAALDKQTGHIVWKTNRSAPIHARLDFRKAFSTPALTTGPGNPQLVCNSADQTNAYDPVTGRELWQVRYSGFSNVPVPIVDRDRVYVVTDFSRPQLWAIRTDGHGEVTNTHVLWKLPRYVGASASPVLVDEFLYFVTDQGVVSCVDAESGKPVWSHRLGGTFSASLVCLGKLIYLASEQGKVTVIAPGKTFQEVASNQLDGRILATPTVTGRALILRTDTHLYRIERGAESPRTGGVAGAALAR